MFPKMGIFIFDINTGTGIQIDESYRKKNIA